MTDKVTYFNGSIHLNHIEVTHGPTTKLVEALNKSLKPFLHATVLNNPDRYTDTASLIVAIHGSTTEHFSVQQFQTWLESFVNKLTCPTWSAFFDVIVDDHGSITTLEQHTFVFSLKDGKVHHRKMK